MHPLLPATQNTYDALGRPTIVVDNWVYGPPNNVSNQTTDYTYDGMGHALTVTALMPSPTPNQVTTYAYGVTPSTGSALFDNDDLHQVIQPGGSEIDTYSYDSAGDLATTAMSDPDGNLHTYFYDALGRQTGDVVTTLGSGVDGTVRMILTAYDGLGLPFLYTSYSSVTGGTTVNQVELIYNGLGQVTDDYESVSGAVTIGTTPDIHYTYTEMAGGANNSRPTGMTYPNGRVLDYDYNSGIDSSIGRLSKIVDDGTGTVLESYKYLGLGTVVEWDHPQTGVNLSYIEQPGETNLITDGGDQYTGLDRFGRVVDQYYTGTSTGRYQYGYDQDGDVLYRDDLVNTALSELYAYDGLGRLTSFERGTMTTPGSISGTPTAAQSFGYDALGNQLTRTTNGSAVTQQFNTLNQETSTTSGTAPTYDADGDTITGSTPFASGETFTYDAWQRLVGVSVGGTVVAAYAYDGIGDRVTESYPGYGVTNVVDFTPGRQAAQESTVVSGTTSVAYQYVNGASGNLVLRDAYSGGTISQRLYTIDDANGDVTALVNTGGAVVEHYEYSPYGVVTILNASLTAITVSAYGWSYLFQGGRQDAVTGLYIFEHRDYNPSSGTWMERDPLGLSAGNDLYQFVDDSPTDYQDPLGTCACNSRELYLLEKIYEKLLDQFNQASKQYNSDLETWKSHFPKIHEHITGQFTLIPPSGNASVEIELEWDPGWSLNTFNQYYSRLTENYETLKKQQNLLNVLYTAIRNVCPDTPIMKPGSAPEPPNRSAVQLPAKIQLDPVPTNPTPLDPAKKPGVIVDPKAPTIDLPPLPK